VYVDPADGDHVTIDEGLGDNIGRWIELAIVVGSLAAIGGGVGLSNTYPTAQALRRTVVAPRPA
jgi:NAD(P)H-flavin reductase